MIHLTNGHSFEYMVASGALGFDGQGWLWEKPLVKMGLIRPELFTTVLKTLTWESRKGNLRWTHPWTCVKLLDDGGAVNKVGLTNPGFIWWCRNIAPYLNYTKYPLVGSIFGTEEELCEMASRLDVFSLKAIELNYSCPNTGHKLETGNEVVRAVRAVKRRTRHPIIVKVSVDQDYLAIAQGVSDVAEAVSINSVPWALAFPSKESPLWKLEQRVKGGGGGVSGKPAQTLNWLAVEQLSEQWALPVIAPSVMSLDDVRHVRALGANAVSFGAIHLRTPWAPTQIALQDSRENKS